MSLIDGHDLKLGAELGVFRGGTTFFLLENAPWLTLHGVDTFEETEGKPQRDFKRLVPIIERRAKEFGDRCVIHTGTTHDVSKEFPNGYFDFVFIDADHSYEAVKRDIEDWMPKVRKGGYLCGHDTQLPGVQEAVKECVEDYEVYYDNFCWIKQVS